MALVNKSSSLADRPSWKKQDQLLSIVEQTYSKFGLQNRVLISLFNAIQCYISSPDNFSDIDKHNLIVLLGMLRDPSTKTLYSISDDEIVLLINLLLGPTCYLPANAFPYIIDILCSTIDTNLMLEKIQITIPIAITSGMIFYLLSHQNFELLNDRFPSSLDLLTLSSSYRTLFFYMDHIHIQQRNRMLITACYLGRYELVELLIRNGADIFLHTPDNKTLLHVIRDQIKSQPQSTLDLIQGRFQQNIVQDPPFPTKQRLVLADQDQFSFLQFHFFDLQSLQYDQSSYENLNELQTFNFNGNNFLKTIKILLNSGYQRSANPDDLNFIRSLQNQIPPQKSIPRLSSTNFNPLPSSKSQLLSIQEKTDSPPPGLHQKASSSRLLLPSQLSSSSSNQPPFQNLFHRPRSMLLEQQKSKQKSIQNLNHQSPYSNT